MASISASEWDKKREQVNISKEDMNLLVMNFLSTEVRFPPCWPRLVAGALEDRCPGQGTAGTTGA